MNLPDLIDGVWVKRYKRFLLDVELDGGEVVTAHCPNPGSMLGCSGEGKRVALSYHPEPHRKLKHTLELVKVGRAWVGVNTMNTNRIVEEALRGKFFNEFSGYDEIRREVIHGRSRFDFELKNKKKGRLLLEVKNVSLAEGGVARFPDSVTERGTRHVDELAEVVKSGERAAVLFLVQRGDVTGFTPAEHIDPAFAAALGRALKAGVVAVAYKCSVTKKRILPVERLPVVVTGSP